MRENDELILHHPIHLQHPLILTEYDGTGRNQCEGCLRYFFYGEAIYTCTQRCSYPLLHEACAEMPREITLSFHPQHTLIQKQRYSICAVCNCGINFGYCCSISSCRFQIHPVCARSIDVIGASERSCIKHPSHPHHELTLLWRPGRAAWLRCDACGAIHRGNSYLCILCQYCINESCAVLPATLERHHLHGHPLTLAYGLPLEYIEYDLEECQVCFKELLPKYWVYHCGLCKYVAHINCAISTSPLMMSNTDADTNVTVFPINDASEEIIGPFVAKLGITAISHDNEIVKGKYKLHNPDHQLHLITPSLHEQEHEQDDNDDDDDDDGDDDDDDLINCGLKSKLVCDGCTAPISSSNIYISCGECNYFVHLTCFQLPAELPSHPFHQEPHHILTLQTPPKLDSVFCNICRFCTNGLFYGCKKCDFKVDVKCVSLPDTIKHEAHPRHHLKLVTQEMTRVGYIRPCSACNSSTLARVCYKCDVCHIMLHSECALLPKQVSNRRWDKHLLLLTFNASANHPSRFYCEVCEKYMNPKWWMYHCRECDVSIHPECLPTTSGDYRNTKFGQRYDLGALHPHPVVHQLTNMLRCNVCRKRKVYGTLGFQCASDKCYFFMCLKWRCGRKHKNDIHAID
ncbi:hypothetical protein AAHA92_07073 [Salvia divinorum]|uniref:Zinc finger PHD-type domain-containing protein n=1 Tax=Salvia divinorum TaxID=28513 RepID=A0ABD1IBB5_SALDI